MKTLRKISNKEWAVVLPDGTYTTDVPQLLAPTATMEALQSIYPQVDLSDIEMVEVEVVVKEEQY